MDYDLEQKTNSLKPGEQLVATYQKKSKVKIPQFITVGNGVATKDFPDDVTMDAFKVFSKLSPAQQLLFIDLKDIYVQQNMANWQAKRRVANPNLIVLDKNKDNEHHQTIRTRMSQNRNGTNLEQTGILKKVKSGTYILNPYVFIPPYNFDEVAKAWEEITTTP